MTAILHVVEHQLLAYRRSWRGSIVSSFVNPIFYLASMGLGLGAIVDRSGGSALGVPYVVFLAPGLLASTAMQTGAGEATFPVLDGFQWSKVFRGIVATPASPAQIALGMLGYIGIRLLFVSVAFVGVIALFGAASSPAILLAIPTTILTGLAFAAPIVAFSATQTGTEGFTNIFRFGITPLFIFSGTFFPIASLPAVVQPIAWATPLYHGVELSRDLALGTAAAHPLATVVHLAYLLVLAGLGAWASTVTFSRRLAV